MKKLLISVFLLLTSLTLQAQEVDGAVKIGGGLDLTTSEVYVTSYFRRGTYKNLVGVQGDLSLERFWKPWVGLGLNLNVGHTFQERDNMDIRYTNIHVGPCYAINSRFGKHFRLDGNMGLGLGMLLGEGSTQYGLGVRASLGGEYMISDGFGLGLEVAEHYTFLFNGRDQYMPDDKLNGIGRFSVLLGIRIYR